MSSWKTFIPFLMMLFLQVLPATSMPNSPSQRVELFAVCAGRYSAMAQHQRLFDGDVSDDSQDIANQFATLVDAVMPDAIAYGMPGRQALSWRVEAKMVQIVLLHEATFHIDVGRADRARSRAEKNLAACAGLTLNS